MRPVAPIVDFILMPFTLLSIVWFRIIRYWGIKNLKISQNLFLRLGMFPVVNHYYEPLIDYRKLPVMPPNTHLLQDAAKQWEFIANFDFNKELTALPIEKKADDKFYYHNGSFGSGDAELYYSIIRYYQPARILEVGCGYSTLIALEAIQKSAGNDPFYICEVTCIEPYEMPFLETLKVKLIRQPVEQTAARIFSELQGGDILFIDSSHIIRPGGDVNFLILEVLSCLNPGVLIHFHDIFIPGYYPTDWLKEEFRLWNEQYLLEAFLLHNDSFEIVFNFHYMMEQDKSMLYGRFPVLKNEPERAPGSIWLRKVR